MPLLTDWQVEKPKRYENSVDVAFTVRRGRLLALKGLQRKKLAGTAKARPEFSQL